MVNVNFNKLTTRQVRALLRDPNNREDGTLVGAAVAKNLIGPDYFVSVAKRLRTYFGNNPALKNNWRVLATIRDGNGKEFVALSEYLKSPK